MGTGIGGENPFFCQDCKFFEEDRTETGKIQLGTCPKTPDDLRVGIRPLLKPSNIEINDGRQIVVMSFSRRLERILNPFSPSNIVIGSDRCSLDDVEENGHRVPHFRQRGSGTTT